ncbi:MAG TPA: hypothetical protein DDZ51_08220 [Planctomycetaceae bacterium]|nr:hypothetical protein [Planctomycetaceae bacterium]
MNQPTVIRLPFHSRALVEIDRFIHGEWSLPKPGESMFDDLPACLHDRHMEIRRRLVQVWKTPIADNLREQLEKRLDSAANVLLERLSTWFLVTTGSPRRFQISNVAACLNELGKVLFSGDGIAGLLERTLASLLKEVRNYTTGHWADQAYGKILSRLCSEPNRIVRRVLEQASVCERLRAAVAHDARACGFQIIASEQKQEINAESLSRHQENAVLLISANY